MRTQNSHEEISRKEFVKLDLTTGIPRILYILREAEGCVQKQLAQLCGIKESSLAVTLKRVEARGYVRKDRIHVAGSKSAYAIYLTETGRQKAEEVAVLMERLDRICLSGFSEKEIAAFYSMLDRVKKNLEGYPKDFLS
ncbi:MAG: MarR family transcriptional regulator [Eubacterium sp.]|nr:MarR family transcriptional regulator [Eubacterium sp.]